MIILSAKEKYKGYANLWLYLVWGGGRGWVGEAPDPLRPVIFTNSCLFGT